MTIKEQISDPQLDPVKITQDLVRCPSVTPEEGGALNYIEGVLSKAGFTCTRLPFSEDGTPDVDNLYARIGKSAPHICFAGHTDVVPVGDLSSWSHGPFDSEISDGKLYGRGTADMKGGVACFMAAALKYIQEEPDRERGSISFLITGDEEGPAINGTVKMLHWLQENGEVPDHCIVGEPTNTGALGDTIKIGRRGSLNGVLTVRGTQGHVAYQALADNPIPGLLDILQGIIAEPLDEGTEFFAPSNLEITTVDVGNTATNVIPEKGVAKFNIRFNDAHTAESLTEHLRSIAAESLRKKSLIHEFRFAKSGDSFLTEPGQLSEILQSAIKKHTGQSAVLSTSGGTSDARFIKDYCPVLEFGLINKTIHQVDEHVDIKDLYALALIYEDFIRNYFKVFNT